MRTNIEIDDELMAAAMQISGHRTKKQTIEEALKEFVSVRRQLEALEAMRGMGWEGDPENMWDERPAELL